MPPTIASCRATEACQYLSFELSKYNTYIEDMKLADNKTTLRDWLNDIRTQKNHKGNILLESQPTLQRNISLRTFGQQEILY